MRDIRIVDRPKGKSQENRDAGASENSFEVHSLNENQESAPMVSSSSSAEERAPTEKVKVRFDKFVQLVATHNFDEILEHNAHEEIVLSSNLLMDLANAHEDMTTPDRKVQMMFAGGLALGIACAFIFFKFF